MSVLKKVIVFFIIMYLSCHSYSLLEKYKCVGLAMLAAHGFAC